LIENQKVPNKDFRFFELAEFTDPIMNPVTLKGTSMTTTVEETEEPQNSRKRETTATIVATVAALGMSVVSSILIARAQKKIHDQIAPESTTEEDE
jgi:hypothetical protein